MVNLLLEPGEGGYVVGILTSNVFALDDFETPIQRPGQPLVLFVVEQADASIRRRKLLEDPSRNDLDAGQSNPSTPA